MLDWKHYRKELAAGVRQLATLSPETIKGYTALSAAGQRKNVLGAKTRELIALAVAVTVRCDGCIVGALYQLAQFLCLGLKSAKSL